MAKSKSSSQPGSLKVLMLAVLVAGTFFVVKNLNKSTNLNSQAKDTSMAGVVRKITPTIMPTTTPTSPNYYLATSGWIVADPNIATTVVSGCNDGDIAISGGMDQYTGPIHIWRTVRSVPSIEWGSNGWVLTMVNESSTQNQFQATVKCLKK
jgi:hypothetical protein